MNEKVEEILAVKQKLWNMEILKLKNRISEIKK